MERGTCCLLHVEEEVQVKSCLFYATVSWIYWKGNLGWKKLNCSASLKLKKKKKDFTYTFCPLIIFLQPLTCDGVFVHCSSPTQVVQLSPKNDKPPTFSCPWPFFLSLGKHEELLQEVEGLNDRLIWAFTWSGTVGASLIPLSVSLTMNNCSRSAIFWVWGRYPPCRNQQPEEDARWTRRVF